MNREHFDVHLATGDTRTSYCRTGYLGFVRRTDLTQSDGGTAYLFALIVVGMFIVREGGSGRGLDTAGWHYGA